MFKNITLDSIMESLLARIPDTMDKRPSSLIYSALMPAAVEIRRAYMALEYVQKNAFASTADREHLLEIAREMSIAPMAATSTVVEGIFNINVPLGTRFKAQQYCFWVRKEGVLSEDGLYRAELICETSGALPNDPYLGRLVPINAAGLAVEIEGLTRAEIVRTLVSGEDEEATEAFRQRYFDSTRWEHYGGNVADYKMMLEAIPGVGGKKIIPVWDGPGTVKAVITDSTNGAPSEEFVASVKEIIDPIGLGGKGYGKAPIDHAVTIAGATTVPINVQLSLIYEAGQAWESVREAATAAIEEYLSEQRTKWETSEGLIVRSAYLDARLLDVPGIKDLQDTQINGTTRNVELGPYEIPVLGEVVAV